MPSRVSNILQAVSGLINDVLYPGSNKVYGTDASGVKGWKADPAGSGSVSDWGDITGSLEDQEDLQEALNLKADGFSLSNVNNTSDANKPVSTAQAAAIASATVFPSDIEIVLPVGFTFGKYENGDIAPWEGLTIIEALTDALTQLAVPVIDGLPTIAGTAVVPNLLTATPSSVTGEEVVNTYHWERDGVTIAGQTGLTYTLTVLDYDTDITIVQTSTNSGGVDTAESAAKVIAALDTDATSYFSVVEGAGGVISDQAKSAYSTFVTTLKGLTNSFTATSEWTSIKELYLPILNANASTTPIRLKAKYPGGKAASVTFTNIIAADYTLSDGIQGNAIDDRSITTDMVVNDLAFDNFHSLVAYNRLAEETLNAAKLYGVPSGKWQSSWGVNNLRLNTYGHSAQSNQIVSIFAGNAGLELFNSTSATSFIQYHGGHSVASNVATRSAWSEPATINYMWSGSGNTHFSGNHWGYSLGTKFDPANVLAISRAFRVLLTALGRDWGNVFFEGDATISGTGTTTGPYPSIAMKLAEGRLGQLNSGTNNDTLALINTNKTTEYPSKMTDQDIYFLHAGYHDLNAGTTGIAMFAYVDSILTYVQQTLGVFNIVIATLPGSTDYNAAEESERLTFNNLIRINQATYGYAIVDFANDPDIGTSNGTFFNGNKNFNDAGALIAGQLSAAAILSVSQYTNTEPGVSGNRIATEADRTLYGSYITVGDLIIDTPTFTNPDGTHNVSYYFMGVEFPALTGTPTIWLDGDLLCPGGEILNTIKFQNTSNVNIPWGNGVVAATFKNIPGTRVTSRNFVCNGLLNWTLEGEGTVQGMFDEFVAGTRHFANNYFGFNIINFLYNGHGVTGTVRTGGTISISGVEIQHGFSAVRLMPNAGTEIIVSNLTIHDLYIHDTLSEAFYIGSTKGGSQPIPRFDGGEIYQVIVARSGGESIQVQNFAGIDIHHITIVNADMDWIAAFQPFQDSCIQWLCNGGENKLRDVLVHGFGSTGLLPFSMPPAGYVAKSINTALVENCLFSESRGIGMYFNNSCSNGIVWNLEGTKFIDFNNTFYAQTGATQLNWIIDSGNTRADTVNINDLVHDGTKSIVLSDVTDYNETNVVLNAGLGAPVFNNYGFPSVKNVMRWDRYWGYYFPVADNTAVQYTAGQYVQYIDEANETLHFYKALTTHTATASTPDIDTTNWVPITWDESGIRSDDAGWTSGDTQSIYPPDDIRLQPTSPYTTMGIQLV